VKLREIQVNAKKVSNAGYAKKSLIHDIFVNYIKKPLKLLGFGKTIITYSNIENITKVPKLYAIVLILFLLAAKTY